MVVLARDERQAQAAVQDPELRLEHPSVRELQQTHAGAGRGGDHRPERCAQPGRPRALALSAAPGGLAEVAAEGLAEAAQRFVARVERGGVEVRALAQLRERTAEPPCTAVGVEGEAIRLLEEAAGPLGRDAERSQLRRPQPAVRALVHGGEQLLDPHGRPAVRFERPAAQARPVAREEGILHRAEELEVLAQGFARRARRPAEDAGRLHARHEDSVVGGVLPKEGALHLGGTRHSIRGHLDLETTPRGPPLPPGFGRRIHAPVSPR